MTSSSKPVILVTGANGFIGQELSNLLIKQNKRVRAALRSDKNNLPPKVEVVVIGEINSNTDWKRTLSNVDTIIHLAGRVHIMNDNAMDPLSEFRKENVSTTENLARQAAAAGVRRFIYLSSIKVNGENTLLGKSFYADDKPQPLDPYGISKYEAEEVLKRIKNESNLEYVIIRPPLVYGPGVKANFHTMMGWLNKMFPLPLGCINNKRSLVALENLVDLIFTCVDHPAAANQIFLVSDGKDLSTTELLNRVAIALDKKIRLLSVNQHFLEFGLKFIGKNKLALRLCGSLQVNINKTRELLNWTPPVDIDDSLRKTAKYFLESHK